MTEFAEKKLFFLRQFYTFYKQKFSNMRPFISITFPKGFKKSKKFGHWTSGSGGKSCLNGMRNTDTKKNHAQ